jgi:hypothetical protein
MLSKNGGVYSAGSTTLVSDIVLFSVGETVSVVFARLPRAHLAAAAAPSPPPFFCVMPAGPCLHVWFQLSKFKPELLEAYPLLKALKERIGSVPSIAAYRAAHPL